MFTGLIESIGTIRRVTARGNYRELAIAANPSLPEVQLGESIAVGGPCLTVVAVNSRTFTVEASQETQKYTTIGDLRAGDRVNLERALRADSRIGGHFVSGHIDSTLEVLRTETIGGSLQITIELPAQWQRLITDKGSIAIDGVSLTVINLKQKSFTVNLIPETQQNTTLRSLGSGDRINVEFDLIGKIILRYLETQGSDTGITWDALRRLGY